MQRTAVQGSPEMLTAITGIWHAGAVSSHEGRHPFRKTLEELTLGDSVVICGTGIVEIGKFGLLRRRLTRKRGLSAVIGALEQRISLEFLLHKGREVDI